MVDFRKKNCIIISAWFSGPKAWFKITVRYANDLKKDRGSFTSTHGSNFYAKIKLFPDQSSCDSLGLYRIQKNEMIETKNDT